MTTPPIFTILNASSAVTALLKGNGILRVFEFGHAPQNVARPYAVWQTINGTPEHFLSDRPDAEEQYIQFDFYADTQSSAKSVRNAVEYALETHARITSYRSEDIEPETKLWRSGFDLSWFIKR